MSVPGGGGPGYYRPGQALGGSAPGSSAMPSDPERTRKIIGAVLYVVGQLVGGLLLLVLFLVPPLFMPDPVGTYGQMLVGGLFAFPAMAVYLTFPRLLDRYDPEPVYALLLCLFWGAIAACGFAATVNTLVGVVAGGIGGAQTGEIVGVVLSAPIVEEATKGLMVLGVAYFLKREFDGVVDGIIYATFVAIGFAATENVIYYAEAMQHGTDTFAFTFVLRGLLAPWGHPLYTSMTGIGLGIARETDKPIMRFVAPVLGYGLAVLLHMLWNGSAVVLDLMGMGELFFVELLLWFVFVGTFVIMVMVLVVRRGRIIRENLRDEVALGNISQRELDIVCSAFGGLSAFFRKGRKGTEFVRAVARLGLSKWHTARAMRGQNRTVSMDFILPLRAKIRELRDAGGSPG